MNKVILIGLGAVGLTCASKLKDNCDLYILTDKQRLEKLKKNKPVFNDKVQEFNYILPDESFNADLIIISVKAGGLDSALKYIKNFVTDKTKIISLLNGISSEEIICKAYPKAKVLKSYYIGNSAIRQNNSVTQDGNWKIVTEGDSDLETLFSRAGIKYSIPDDITYSMWLKFTLNIISNQPSAILNFNFGELKRNKSFLNFAKNIISEVRTIAECVNVNNIENLEKDSFEALNKAADEGKTSMLQDILAKRPTEVDIFAGEIIKLGKQFGIKTPYNQVLYDLIKIKEEDNEHSIHSC